MAPSWKEKEEKRKKTQQGSGRGPVKRPAVPTIYQRPRCKGRAPMHAPIQNPGNTPGDPGPQAQPQLQPGGGAPPEPQVHNPTLDPPRSNAATKPVASKQKRRPHHCCTRTRPEAGTSAEHPAVVSKKDYFAHTLSELGDKETPLSETLLAVHRHVFQSVWTPSLSFLGCYFQLYGL